MDALTKSFLMDIRGDPRYAGFIADMERLRPNPPHYDWRTDNINEVKSVSLERDGFDKIFSLLKPK